MLYVSNDTTYFSWCIERDSRNFMNVHISTCTLGSVFPLVFVSNELMASQLNTITHRGKPTGIHLHRHNTSNLIKLRVGACLN